MIISVSRRTDIPALYSKWFINRVRAGWCQVPSPRNYHQLSYVSLKPKDVEVIVFWSKNPAPIISYLDELDERGYRYYFQVTVNNYPKILEPGIPSLEQRIQTFRKIADRLGPRRVIWRYDPIIISNRTPTEFHLNNFSKIAGALRGFTSRVMVSFVDYYEKVDRKLCEIENQGFQFSREVANDQDGWQLLMDMAKVAEKHNIEVFTCAEERDYSEVGVPPGRCIDGELLRELWSLRGYSKKDPTQRKECLCVVSKDIGMNDTCLNGCPYCYSTRKLALAERRYSEHNPDSPVLWGKARPLSETEQADQLKARLI